MAHNDDDTNETDDSSFTSAGLTDGIYNPSIEVSEDELAALKDEVNTLHDGNLKTGAERLMEEKLSAAVLSISKLATSASAERVRLDASKYIVERVLGPLSKIEFEKDLNKDPIVRMLKRAGMISEDL